MNIVVCVKQVPDTNEVRIDPKTGTLIREGVPSIINPDDLGGIEAALQLKDRYGGQVIVLTMGPLQADFALREALAMGVDRAILVTDRAFAGSDTWATSYTLAAALRQIPHDIIITGRQAIDGDTAQVGPQIAEHLGIPAVTYVQGIERENERLIVKRMFEDGYQRIAVRMPCLLTILKEIHTPRTMRVGRIYAAYRDYQVDIWSANQLAVDPINLGLKGSPTKVLTSFTKGAKSAGKVFDVSPNEAVQLIVNALHDKFIIG